MNRKNKFKFYFLFLMISQLLNAAEIGSCIHDPNALKLQNEWKHYHDVKKKRSKINTSVLVEKIRMDSETMKILQSVSEVENLMKYLDQLESRYLKKAFVDKRFNEMISSPDFVERLISKQMDQEIKSSELKFKDDPKFYEILDKIRAEVMRPEIKEALELFRTYDLGVLEAEYRKSAKAALHLIRQKGATLEAVRSWINDPPYLRNVPLPAKKIGPFAIRYRSLLMKSIASFVRDREVSLEEAKKLFPRIKIEEVNEMNKLLPPTESNSFDDHVYNINPPREAAIDGVARTLWGEATSCQDQGLPQFEAIGKIIAERSMAVCRAIAEEKELATKNTEVREKNWSTFLKNWAGISRPAPGMQNKAYNKLKGLSDFGRKEKVEIPCAAQVISKKNQFSVWNSYSLKKYHVGQFQQNIPDAVYEIQGPQSPNDDQALIRILCPEFQTEAQKKLWEHAKEIATKIVDNPQLLTKNYTWPKNLEILFYTHDASLPFAKEVKISTIKIDGKEFKLRGKGAGACHKFRLFVPKNSAQY